jgi:hypothetical protein
MAWVDDTLNRPCGGHVLTPTRNCLPKENMRRLYRFLILLVLCTVSQSADTNGQWTSLFNGNDLSGWNAMNGAVFCVTNGMIHLPKTTGWLRSEREYTNFSFEAECRALEPNYNSGYFLRTGLEGKPFPVDVWQVNLKESALGSLMKGSKTVVQSTTAALPTNQWFTFRMEARGKTLTLFVNGAKAWELKDFEPERGYIGLQAEGREFDFRNLRLRELP